MGLVGANIRAARVAQGLTQAALGEALGVRGKDVSRWENGDVEPGANNRHRLADLLFNGDVSLMYRDDAERTAA